MNSQRHKIEEMLGTPHLQWKEHRHWDSFEAEYGGWDFMIVLHNKGKLDEVTVYSVFYRTFSKEYTALDTMYLTFNQASDRANLLLKELCEQLCR